MGRKVTFEQPIPPLKPDTCQKCVFLGKIPKHKRKKGAKKTMICMATMKAISHESISIKESERKGTKHIFHRPCDNKWEAWWKLPRGMFNLSINVYNECRIPYEQSLQYEIDFD